MPILALAAPPSLDLKKGDHLVLIGNTFAERMQYFGYFETLVNLHYPEANPVIRNLGWAADEVTRIHLQVLKGGGYITEPTDEPVPLQPRPFNFGSMEAHLTEQKADVILLCFGFNEAFQGKAGLDSFAADYQAYIDGLKDQQFNGKSKPRLILISPIAQEKLPAPFPDPTKQNENLKLYTEKIAEIAEANSLGFVNLFSPTIELMSRGNAEPLTMNGVHLNDTGHRVVAEIMATTLGMTEPWSEKAEAIRKLVVAKNEQFFFRWRPINGEYVYGRRKDPFGVITYPPELAQWEQMTADLDQKIWAESKKLNAAASQ
ncbi:MAG: SGNH/GDSL hydrolase family protein [Verrucomicrobiae bacterium]|nr:SGNH/GDSL hydrolase family protein [Verrucomicrobiae bacterium]